MKPKVVAVVGPTAVGKTRLGIEIANRFNGEVISGDSMQVYKGMDIGTAKVTREEMRGIPHHMIDIKDPEDGFSAADFQHDVQRLINEISSRGKLPILVGGTGLYIQATLFDFNFSSRKRDEGVIRDLERQAEAYGYQHLYERLRKLDPEQAKKIHPNNSRRLIRALEIIETTGKRMSTLAEEQVTESPFQPMLIGLSMNREVLYERINDRVDQMIRDGLVEEVKGFYERGLADHQSMQAIGYKEFIPYFRGEISLEKAVELLKRNSRRYAKRQFTYFRNKMDVAWYEIEEGSFDEQVETILSDLAGMLSTNIE